MTPNSGSSGQFADSEVPMSYLEKVLEPNETIVYRTTVSWTLYIPGLLVLLVAIAVYIASSLILTSKAVVDALTLIPALLALACPASAPMGQIELIA